MTRRPEDHVLAVEEGRLSPIVVVVTALLVVLFLLGLLYRAGLALL